MKWMRSGFGFVLVVVMVGLGCGCGRDVRLAGKKVRHVEVKEVTHFDLQLNGAATPEQVAYVALRAIRDDFFAKSGAERESALDIQFDVAAAGVIETRNRSSLARDDYLHHVVTHWTPAVSHYAGDFETNLEAARSRLVNRGATKSGAGDVSEIELAMEVRDPGNDPAAGAVMRIWLARDGGMWRVTHFGFEPRRTLATARASSG